jgi:hypothetical protein
MKCVVVAVFLSVITLCTSVRADAQADFDPVLPQVQEGIQGTERLAQASEGVHLRVVPKGAHSNLASYVGSLRIHPALLSKPTRSEVDTSKPFISTGVPLQHAVLTLEIDGIGYELVFQDETQDPANRIRHVTMVALNHSHAYARFAVDDATGRVLGTLVTSAATFRIIPGRDVPEQHIYRVAGRSNRVPGLELDPAAAKLELRHIQLEEVSVLKPNRALVSPVARAIYMQGGELGRMDGSATEFGALPRRLSVLTRADGSEAFEVASRLGLNNGLTRIRFNQLINGIPVRADNEVILDSDGAIVQLSIQLASTNKDNTSFRLNEKDAIEIAKNVWGREFGRELISIEFVSSPKLWLIPRAPLEDVSLVYEFVFSVNGEADRYVASVDATTGDVTVVSTTKWSDTGTSTKLSNEAG